MSDPAAPQGEDPRVEELRQGLWDVFIRLGGDNDGEATPKALVSPIVPIVLELAAEMREELDNLYGSEESLGLNLAIAREELETLRLENAKLRESNTILNRRVTKAEAIVAQRVEEQERKGKSLGRSLANAGYYALKAENQRFREALEVMAAYHHERECKPGDNTAECLMMRAALDPSSTGTK